MGHQEPPQPRMGSFRRQSGQMGGYSFCPSQKNVRFLTTPISSIRLMAKASWETLWPDPCGDSQESRLRDSQGPPRPKEHSLMLPTAPALLGAPCPGLAPTRTTRPVWPDTEDSGQKTRGLSSSSDPGAASEPLAPLSPPPPKGPQLCPSQLGSRGRLPPWT